MKRRNFFEKLGAGTAIAAFAKTVPVDASVIEQKQDFKLDGNRFRSIYPSNWQMEMVLAYQDKEISQIIGLQYRGLGKTYLATLLMYMHAIQNDNSTLVIGRTAMNRNKQEYKDRMLDVSSGYSGSRFPTPKFVSPDNYFQFHNGSRIFLFDLTHSEVDPFYSRFGSLRLDACVVESVSTVEPSAIHSLRAAIRKGANQKMVLLDTPLSYEATWEEMELHGSYYSQTLTEKTKIIRG